MERVPHGACHAPRAIQLSSAERRPSANAEPIAEQVHIQILDGNHVPCAHEIPGKIKWAQHFVSHAHQVQLLLDRQDQDILL